MPGSFGTSLSQFCLGAEKQAADLVDRFTKRRPSHVVLGSRVFDRRSRGSGFGLWRNRGRIGWNRKDPVLRLSGPAFGFPRHPFYEGTARSLRRASHGEKILTERLKRCRARDAQI